MTVQLADLAAYLGVTPSSDGYGFVQSALSTAQTLVSTYVGETEEYVYPPLVPDKVMDQAVMSVGAELFQQRKAPSGISQFSDFEGVGMRVARDPMTGAYPLLSNYVKGGFA